MQPSSDVAGGTTSGLELRPPRNRVSPRAIWYWTTRAAVGWVFLLGVETIWVIADADRRGWALAALGGSVVAAAVHLAVMPQWRYRVHRWEVT